jgi:hypothetical protein
VGTKDKCEFVFAHKTNRLMHKLLRPESKPSSGGTRTAQVDCQADVKSGLLIHRVRCHSKRCKTCGPIWAGDFRQRVLRSCVAHGADVALVTVTAPGQHGPNRLPFIPSTRTVLPDAARRWNLTCENRWSKLHRSAVTSTRRKYGEFRLVAYVWEFQKRGVKHGHFLVPGSTPRERAAATYYANRLNELAPLYGFGHVELGAEFGGTKYEFVSVVRMQAYLAKYVTKDGANGLPEMLETALQPQAPKRPFYVQPGLSPWTMEQLRRPRQAHILLKLHGCEGLQHHDAQSPDAVNAIIARLLELDRPPPAAV